MTYTKDELLSELREAHQEDGKIYNILNDRLNDYPTVPTYNKYFDTLDEAYAAAGLDRKKFEVKQTGHNFDIEAALDKKPGYDPDADGYVYVLKFEQQESGWQFVYVGSTERHLPYRLSQHRSKNGGFSAPKKVNGTLVKVAVHRHESHIQEIMEIQSFYTEDYELGDNWLGGIINAQEKIRHNELVEEYGPSNVIGGN